MFGILFTVSLLDIIRRVMSAMCHDSAIVTTVICVLNLSINVYNISHHALRVMKHKLPGNHRLEEQIKWCKHQKLRVAGRNITPKI